MAGNHEHIKNLAAWKVCRAEVLDRDEHQCLRCGSEDDLTVDHVTPLDVLFAHGVTPEALAWACDPDNCVTLCRRCNGRKGSTIEHELTRTTWVAPAYVDRLAWLFDDREPDDVDEVGIVL
ncbi:MULTISPECIES: HNH endonuclease [unclassified Aeromicrobium]|uniref:HNH endonuclease n=1 Tax=unclassified Aeromicrobium TaxID=2633570 RepID=UPI002889DE66|nr:MULTISPECIES: HNH endonuclease [unclassified Aeromicrobium]